MFEQFQKDLEKISRRRRKLRVKIDAKPSMAARSRCPPRWMARPVIPGIPILKPSGCRSSLVEKESFATLAKIGIRFHPAVVRALGGEKGKATRWTRAAREHSRPVSIWTRSAGTSGSKLDRIRGQGPSRRAVPVQRKEIPDQLRGSLAVVVFVQDDKTRHVLQAGYVDLGTSAGASPTTEANGSVQE